jgi:autophagy-related protein 18
MSERRGSESGGGSADDLDVEDEKLYDATVDNVPPPGPLRHVPDLMSVQFNQNGTCAAISYSQGYRIFQTSPCKLVVDITKNAFKRRPSKPDDHDADDSPVIIVPSQVSMLLTTSLIALTGSGENESFSPRCVRLVNTKNPHAPPICELNFKETVLAVHLNPERLVAVTENKVQIFEMTTMKNLKSIDTCVNRRGISAVSCGKEKCFVAIPADEKKGKLFIYDAMSLNVISIIQASQSSVRCVAFNHDASLVATTSDRGTIIRVFTVPGGDKVYEFRRGLQTAKITALSFNANSSLLCASTDHNSVHIYEMLEDSKLYVTDMIALVTDHNLF